MKKLLKMIGVCSAMSGVFPSVADGQEAPYILTQSIHNIPIDKQECVQLLKKYAVSDDEDNQLSHQLTQNIEELQQQLVELGKTFDILNEEIAHLQGEEVDIVQQELENAIENAYEILRENENFIQLTQEEQVKRIENDEKVIEWQHKVEEMTQLLNDKIVERDEVETLYSQIQFDIEDYTTQLEKAKSTRSQYNQCALYPYSAPVELADTLLINEQSESLSSFLVQIDHYLQRMVPLPYRKVKFEDIALFFNVNQELESIESRLEGKHSIYLDEQGQYYYSYAREMNLLDVEILANLSLERYLKTGDLASHVSQYEMVLAIKEGQFDYFMAINEESLRHIKQLLANYLNHHELYDVDSIEIVRQFHQRYQFKCVVFNERTNEWEVVPNDETGYEEEYWQKDLTQGEEESKENITASEDEIEEEVPEVEVMNNNDDTKKSNLSSVKEALMKRKNKKDKKKQDDNKLKNHDKSKNKPKDKKEEKKHTKKQQESEQNPQKKADKIKSSQKPKKTKGKGNEKESSLPTTGEQQTILWGAIMLLTISIILFGYNSYQKYKLKQSQQKIELD